MDPIIDMERTAEILAERLGISMDKPSGASRPEPSRRLLIHCPDAMGVEQLRRWPDIHERLLRQTQRSWTVRAPMPPKTPTCFASMLSGVGTELHRRSGSDRSRFDGRTLLDEARASGLRISIFTLAGSSISLMFGDRAHLLHAARSDAEAVAYACEHLRADGCDLCLVYTSAYDDQLHRDDPFGPACRAAALDQIGHFERLVSAARLGWESCVGSWAWCPDHGAHQGGTGNGCHGDDLPEDRIALHALGGRMAIHA